MSTVVIVTGSREFTDELQIVNDLEILRLEDPDLFICVGDADGADKFVRNWGMWQAARSSGVDGKTFVADWNRKCDNKCYHPLRFKEVDDILVPYCPVAGNIRNQEMVDYAVARPEYVRDKVIGLAYRKLGAKNKGTSDCTRRMKKAGIKVRIHVQK